MEERSSRKYRNSEIAALRKNGPLPDRSSRRGIIDRLRVETKKAAELLRGCGKPWKELVV